MINPISIMKVVNQRHICMENHKDFSPFLKKSFGEKIILEQY